MTDSVKLLLTEEEWATRRNSGKASSEKKKQIDPNACQRCGKTGHWARECPNRKQEKKVEAHLAQADNDDEATILMTMFYALHDVEAEEKGEVTMVEEPRKALKAVNLDEPRAQVHLGRVGADQELRWYLDSSASNHMTGSKASFSELDDDVTGTVMLPPPPPARRPNSMPLPPPLFSQIGSQPTQQQLGSSGVLQILKYLSP